MFKAMGKDHELLEAARTGNIQQLEKLLGSKVRKPSGEKGPLSTAFERLQFFGNRLPNIHCVDSNGETPLHLAALNGHKDFVQILLQNEASTNAVDEKGCTPLHLAAWSGRSDICMLLLQPSGIPTQINMQNISGDTALHFAAQHGHTGTVSILLQDKADPTIRNIANDSPLDFAAQYGRTDVVKQLLSTYPNLTKHIMPDHSPIHRAARAGHTSIVKYLLNAGFPINLKTSSGTPLHEAARYCKVDVIKLLLERGVDVTEKDSYGLNAIEILSALPAQKACEAIALIKDRTPSEDEYPDTFPESPAKPVPAPRTSILRDNTETADHTYSLEVDVEKCVQSTDVVSPDVSPPPIPPRQPSMIVTKRDTALLYPNDDDVYDVPPVQPTPVSTGVVLPDNMSSSISVPVKKPQKPPRASKTLSVSPQSKPPQPSPAPRKTSDPESAEIPEESDSTEQDQYEYIRMSSLVVDAQTNKTEYVNIHIPGVVLKKEDNNDDDDVKVVKGASTSDEGGKKVPDHKIQNEHVGSDDGRKEDEAKGEGQVKNENESQTEDVEVKNHTEAGVVEVTEKSMANDDKISDTLEEKPASVSVDQDVGEGASAYDEVIFSYPSGKLNTNIREQFEVEKSGFTPPESTKNGNGDKAQKPSSLPLDSKRISLGGSEIPLSPSSYVQPPTPDHPPPSPTTAEKRKSKDMETLTDSYLLADTNIAKLADNEILTVSVSDNPDSEKSNIPDEIPDSEDNLTIKVERGHSQILETVPEKVEETVNSSEVKESSEGDNSGGDNSSSHKVVFSAAAAVASAVGGGEVDTSMFAGLLRGSTPGGSRDVVSQICEKVAVRHVKSKRRSTPSAFITFDPLMEKEEDKDINTEEVLRAIDAIEATAQHAAEKKHDDSTIFDDSEEWAKIEATLAGFGAAMTRESVFIREYEDDFKRLLAASANSKMQSVGDWLDRLGLGQYENTLVANGYDDTDFLGGNVLEDGDLENIGIKDENHRKKILEAAKNLPKITPIDQDRLVMSVKDWLASLRLEQYLDTFNSHKYNTMQRVIKLWELELSTVLDITSIGHRKRILESLGDRPPPEKKDSSNNSPALVKRDAHEPHEVKNIPDLFKDYTGVKSTAVDEGEVSIPTQKPLLMFEKNEEFINGQGQHIHDSSIHIRPPHLAHTTGSIRQWRHKPEILIKGCCNYTAQYLGSTLVKELKGPGSTQEGISKLKQRLRRKLQKSTDVIAKIPTIMLSISYRGVKFIDAKSKKVICDHEIANIFCACQDAEHLNFFAYITKDRETEKHYCHVFSVRSRELAGEIILTLGEAFEIAYQMALKEKAEEEALEFERKLSQNSPDDTTSSSSKGSESAA